jgi:hypothetical protein
LELSAAGRDLLPKLLEIDASITAMTSGRLSPDERELLATALRKVIAGTLGGQAVARRFARQQSGPEESGRQESGPEESAP